MRTAARVHDVRAGRAWLACEAAAGCPSCSGGRGCALRWLSRPGEPLLEVPERRPDGGRLSPGEAVTIEVPEGELLRAAARAYLPPLAGLLAGPAVAVAWTADELPALLAAVAGLAAGWTVARSWLRRSPPRYRLAGPERP